MVSGESGFSILQFCFVSFFSILMSNRLSEPVFTDLCRMTEAMLYAEPELDEEKLEEVNYIVQHTDEEIDMPLASLELLTFHQIQTQHGGLNKEIDIDGKSYKIIDLYRHLNAVNRKLVEIIVGISKKYNLEIPVQMAQTTKLQL